MITIQPYQSQYHNYILQFEYFPEIVQMCRELKNDLGWQKFTYFNKDDVKGWCFSSENLQTIKSFFENNQIEVVVLTGDFLTDNSEEPDIEIEPTEVEGLPLFEYQKKGVTFASQNARCLIADEMGLGKTLQAIGTVENLKLERALVICPASLKNNWKKEIEKWTNKKAILDEEAMQNPNTKTNYVITNYERLHKILDVCKWFKPEIMIFDESHYIKNPTAKRTIRAYNLSSIVPRVILLTGTPILNRPEELWTSICLCRKTSIFGDKRTFNALYKGFHNIHRLGNLKNKVKPFILRRLKDDVLTELPDKMINTIDLDLDLEKYKKSIKTMLGDLDLESSKSQKLKAIGKKLLNNTATTSQLGEFTDKLHDIRKGIAEQKLPFVIETMRQFLSEGKKLVVFGVYLDYVNELYEKFEDNAVLMTSKTKVNDRQDLVDKFQEDSSCNFFISTMRVGGTGYTLTNARDMLFYELEWTPALHRQSEDRIHRIGQKNACTVNYVTMRGTFDSKIIKLLSNKTLIIKKLVGGKGVEL